MERSGDNMDDRVLRLKTPQECELFAANAVERGRVDLAFQARRRGIELRGAEFSAKDNVERECIEAVLAYEETLYLKHGKRIKASRTRQVIENKGIIQAVDDIVCHETPTVGFEALEKAGLLDCAFEAVVLRQRKRFSAKAVRNAEERLKEHRDSRDLLGR
jgi:hypothetical protein